MENVFQDNSKNSYVMLTRLDSSVPIPYLSWFDFNPLQAIKPVDYNPNEKYAMACAFISNCVSERSGVLTELMALGVTVDSYGGCHHNRDENSVSSVSGKLFCLLLVNIARTVYLILTHAR